MIKYGLKRTKILYQSSDTIIYKAIRVEDGAPIIIKKLAKEEPSPIDIARLIKEYRVVKQLDHPGIAKVLKYVDAENMMLIEDCGGASLDAIILRKKIDLKLTLQIAIALADCIKYLHSKNIIHLDINPSNIVWSPETANLKLIDFGNSKNFENESVQKEFFALEGTPAYMSPEQTGRSKRIVDNRSDLYSFGVTLYEILAGRPPHCHKDELELLHAHVAISHQELFEVDNKIPKVLSEIVSKLLSKDCEERYQSIQGVKWDLERCAENLKINKIDYFKIGEKDRKVVFSLPKKIYFREKCLTKIERRYKEVLAEKDSQILIIGGNSGEGKTALVNEFAKTVNKRDSYFIGGKIDQIRNPFAQTVLYDIFENLFEQIISEKKSNINHWRKKLTKGIYPLGPIITNYMPISKSVIDTQPETIDNEPHESRKRLDQALLKLVETVTDDKKALVIFIDDIQWASDDVFSFIRAFIKNRVKKTLIIMTCRDNELKKGHPILDLKKKIEKSTVGLTQVKLKPFIIEQTKAYVSDTIGHGADGVEDLVRLCHIRTNGNPFYLGQFLLSLYKHGAIQHDDHKKWVWEPGKCSNIDIFKDIFKLMQSKISELSRLSQHVLKVASFLNYKITLERLIIGCGLKRNHTIMSLHEIVSNGLMSATSDFDYLGIVNKGIHVEFAFIHDKIKQAAIHHISPSESKDLFFEIGSRFHSAFKKGNNNVTVFDVVNFLNHSPEMINEDDINDICRLNYEAGLLLNKATAREKSLKYFSLGISMFKERSWNEDYKFALNLHLYCAETALLCAKYDQVNTLTDIVIEKSITILDECYAWDLKIRERISRGYPEEAVNIGINALNRLGIKVRRKKPKISILAIYLKNKVKLKWALKNWENKPKMTDDKMLLASRILMRLTSPSWIISPITLVSVGMAFIEISIKYGFNPYTAYVLSLFAGYLSIKGDMENGRKYAAFANAYAEKYDPKIISPRVCYITHAIVGTWTRPYKDLSNDLIEKYHIAKNVGDLEAAALCITAHSYIRYLYGEKLFGLNVFMSRFKEEVKNFELVESCYATYLQLIKNLIENPEDPRKLIGSACDENEVLERCIEKNNQTGLFDFFTKKLMLAFLFGDYKNAIKMSDQAKKYLNVAIIKHDVPIFIFYTSLTTSALIKNRIKKYDRQNKKTIESLLKKMERFANSCPENFSHKYYLMLAEKYLLKDERSKAERYYRKAADEARKNGIIHEFALVLEIMSDFYLKTQPELSLFYIRSAYSEYEKWGAHAKCRALDVRINQLKGNQPQPDITAYKKNEFEVAPNNNAANYDDDLDRIDFLSILKASNIISENIEIDQLSFRLIEVVMQNAGAQKGVLIIENNVDTYCIDENGAYKTNATEGIYPRTIIERVKQDKACFVNGNISGEAIHGGGDHYLASRNVKSFICMPLTIGDKLVALIYLENKNISNAFTKKRKKVIELLAAQATISIENAKLYNYRIEKEIAEEKTKAKSRFLAHMSHEIRTPLNTIIGYSELLKEKQKNEGENNYLENIIYSGRNLLALVDDVLDFSKIEKGMIKIQKNPISIGELFADLRGQYQRPFNDKGILFSVETDENLHNKRIKLDELRIRQILGNLLSNSLKFTEDGYVKLSAKANNFQGNSTDVEFCVSDSGIGIDDTSRIYVDFEKLDTKKYEYDGFGLGLAIVKKIVDLLDGAIEVESKPGKGSSFKIVLKSVEVSDGDANNTIADCSRHIIFDECKILVVDDNEMNRKFIIDCLEGQPIQLFKAKDGLQAKKMLQKTAFDLVLLDVKLPKYSGAEITSYIKLYKKLSTVPVVIVTADVTKETEMDLLERGCDVYLRKPITKYILFETMKQFIGYKVLERKTKNLCIITKNQGSIPENIDKVIAERITGELERLKGSKLEKIQKSMIFGEIKEFAYEVFVLGQKHKINMLVDWGSELEKHAGNFDIQKTEGTIRTYDEMIEVFRSRSF